MEKKFPTRDNNFNFLRLVLAASVILSHSPELTDGRRTREPLTFLFHLFSLPAPLSLGDLAVDSFFILSGFLIVQSWQSRPHLLDFLKNRALRIYPAFIVASLISALLVGPLAAPTASYFPHLNPSALLRGIVFLQKPAVPPVFEGTKYAALNAPMWTISYEFRCYLLVALLGMCGFFKYRGAWFSFSLGIVLLSFMIYRFPALNEVHFRYSNILIADWSRIYRLVPFFCAGGCFYLYREKVAFKPTWLTVAIVILFLSFLTPRSQTIGLILIWSYLLFYFAFSHIPLLDHFKKMPDVSYGIYLYGWPIQKLLLWYMPSLSPWLLFPLALVAAYVCGLISWKLIERPALKFKGSSVTS